jgi:hypothetical protein
VALKTLGSNAQTTLHALVQNTNLSATDAATFRANVLYDGVYVNHAWVAVQNNQVYPGGYEMQGGQGLLYVPRRGVLKVLEGDYIAYDATGWPILVSGFAIQSASTSWTHS